MAKEKRKLGSRTEMLQVRLADADYLARAKEMANLQQRLREHEAEAEEQKKALKKAGDGIAKEVERLSHVLLTSSEPQEVTVVAYANFVTNMFEEVRMDTSEVVRKSPLEDHHRQGTFDLDLWRAAAEARQEEVTP